MIFGGFFMAMPLAIIGHNFEAVWESFQREKQRAAASSRAQRGVAIEIKPIGAQTKNAIKAGFLKHYFDLILSGNELRCLMQANGTAQFQLAMEQEERSELDRIGGGGMNAKHHLLTDAMVSFFLCVFSIALRVCVCVKVIQLFFLPFYRFNFFLHILF